MQNLTQQHLIRKPLQQQQQPQSPWIKQELQQYLEQQLKTKQDQKQQQQQKEYQNPQQQQAQRLQLWLQQQQPQMKDKLQTNQIGEAARNGRQITLAEQKTYRGSMSAPGALHSSKKAASSRSELQYLKRWPLKYSFNPRNARHSVGLLPSSHSGKLSCFNIYFSINVCILILGVAVLFTSLFAHPFHRGFFCDDDSIRYPLMSSTISTVMLACVSFLLPLTVFVGVEGVRLFDTSTPRDSWHSVFCSLGRSLYELFGVFIFGAGLNQVTVDVGKYSVGRLRPHFVAVCAPFGQLCQTSADTHQYVSEYECTGDPAVIEEARLSFPSGHAALAFYTAVYLSVFLQQRLYWRSARLPRHLLQGVVLLMAWYTALSRVHDNMHHPTDVLAGSVIGIVWALLLTTFVIDMRLDCSHATKDELRSLRTNPAHIQGANSV